MRLRMFSTSMAMSRMSLGRLGATIVSAKLPSVMRRQDAARCAIGRVMAARLNKPRNRPVPKIASTMAPSTQSRQPLISCSSAVALAAACARCVFWVSKSARRWSNLALPRSAVGALTTAGALGVTLAMTGSA